MLENIESKEDLSSISYTSSLEYCAILEDKLKTVLGSVKGAGNVNVMVTLESGPELKIATQIDERTNTNTNSSGTTYHEIVDDGSQYVNNKQPASSFALDVGCLLFFTIFLIFITY